MDSAKRKSSDSLASEPPLKKCHWSLGLKASMENPDLKLLEDDDIVIIKDKYPKAKFHLLVLPKENIPNLKSLKTQHLPLLKHMESEGQKFMKSLNPEMAFKSGYHAIPSMSHIHLHVISLDFDSPCLKTKKHWNSFTTSYFIDSKDLMKKLENDMEIKSLSDSKGLLNTPLRCHACAEAQATMPKLKEHLKICKSVKSLISIK